MHHECATNTKELKSVPADTSARLLPSSSSTNSSSSSFIIIIVFFFIFFFFVHFIFVVVDEVLPGLCNTALSRGGEDKAAARRPVGRPLPRACRIPVYPSPTRRPHTAHPSFPPLLLPLFLSFFLLSFCSSSWGREAPGAAAARDAAAMFESLVSWILSKFLSEYVKNFDAKAINVGLTSGMLAAHWSAMGPAGT